MDTAKQRVAGLFHRILVVSRSCLVAGIVGLFISVVIIHQWNEPLAAFVGMLCFLITVVAGMACVVALLVRDVAGSPRTHPRFGVRSLLIAMTLLAMGFGLIGYLVHNVPRWRAEQARLDAEYERQSTADMAESQQLIADIEAIRAKLGRYPKDEAEIVELRHKPMPVSHSRNEPPCPVRYSKRPEDKTYTLTFFGCSTEARYRP